MTTADYSILRLIQMDLGERRNCLSALSTTAAPQNTVVGADVLQLMAELGCVEPPPCPRDIRLWLDSQETTSAMLRPPSVTSRHGSIF